MSTAMTRHETFEGIARKHLGIETLKERKSDSLDFDDVSVWQIERAMAAAYSTGIQELLLAAEALIAAKEALMETPDEWRALKKAVRRARQNNIE